MSDDVFLALANPARRRLLELLVDGPRTAGDLAAEFEMSRPAVAEHLQVLRRAALVHAEPVGRQRFYRIETSPLESVSEWLHPFERFWQGRLRRMAIFWRRRISMTDARIGTVSVDQFIAAAPAQVWRALTEPDLLAKWWVPGDVQPTVGHRFHLEMPGFGSIPCIVAEVEPYERFVFTFNGHWLLTWRLVAEGNGTRLLLDHTGFDLDDKREQNAFERMGIGWRDAVLPRLAQTVPDLD